jgi:hypothetical protein
MSRVCEIIPDADIPAVLLSLLPIFTYFQFLVPNSHRLSSSSSAFYIPIQALVSSNNEEVLTHIQIP